jgi:hypothetical protein
MSYVIQLLGDRNLCLGVESAAANSTVKLMQLAGAGNPNTQWNMDANTGLITLVADKNMYLDIQGTDLSNGTAIIIANYVLGRPTQSWNWVGNPNFILNNGGPTFCVDATSTWTVGADTHMWSQSQNNQNQKWSILSVPAMQAAMEMATA